MEGKRKWIQGGKRKEKKKKSPFLDPITGVFLELSCTAGKGWGRGRIFQGSLASKASAISN